ncbi:unnamed protein product [Fraxinus pennsylvanica]|uniref:Reverse transcriptase n=1 Tax=Fraxinus pennsylvanica TaxID=56036 RepID=A0AAD2AB55_9LAMI|nr:unnamed protein product [Fraxinus pennsylvanica]
MDELDPRIIEFESQTAPTEELESFPLDIQDASTIFQVGKNLGDKPNEELKTSFARTQTQKMIALNTNRYDTLKEEVEKLISNGFIGKATYPKSSGKFLGYIVNQRGIEANPGMIKALIEMWSPQKPKEVPEIEMSMESVKPPTWNLFVDGSSGEAGSGA